MKETTKTLVCVFALLVPCLATAQDAPPSDSKEMAKARKAAFSFLTKGRYAPWPGLKEADFARGEGWLEDPRLISPGHRGRCFGFSYGQRGTRGFLIRVSPTLEVVYYVAAGRDFEIPTHDATGGRLTDAERRQELALIRGFSDRELRARARRFLQQVYLRFAQRRFVVRAEETILNAAAQRVIRYEERPARGTVATYPNRITLCMNPGTGEVTIYTSTVVHAALEKAPPVGKDQAQATAVKLSKLPRVASSELLLILKKNVPTPVWLVVTEDPAGSRKATLLSAQTGKEVSFEETLE